MNESNNFPQVDEYIEGELFQAMPVPFENCGQIKMQIRSEKGKTKWLNVSPQKMREIEQILIQKDS
jgi:hypothetical protein